VIASRWGYGLSFILVTLLIIPLTTASSFASVNVAEDIILDSSSVDCNGVLHGHITIQNLSTEPLYINSAYLYEEDLPLQQALGSNTFSYSALPVPGGETVNLPFTITQTGGTTKEDPEPASLKASVNYNSASDEHGTNIVATQTYFITGCPIHQDANSSSSNSNSSSGLPIPSKCLIATAAFGSDLAPQVQFLRVFRDQNILSTTSGSSFMHVFNAWYYSFSPSVANYERGQPWMQQMVRTSIYPLLGMLTLSQKAYSMLPGEYGAISAGLIASSLIGAVYFFPFGLAIKQVRKYSLNPKIAIAIVSASVIAVISSVITGNTVALMMTTSILVLTTLSISAIYSANMITRIVNKFRNRNFDTVMTK
jgi:peptide/nickel transport system substrate-binding protein